MSIFNLKRVFINSELIGVGPGVPNDHLQLRGKVSGLDRIAGVLRRLAETAMLRHRPCSKGIRYVSCLFGGQEPTYTL